jgi:hypothetical protein
MTQGIVQQCYARRRDLPIALAHVVAGTKPYSLALERLNRLYAGLTPADQLRCRAELLECREARRGVALALVEFKSKEGTKS